MGARAAGPTVARMLLGGRLRQLREASGMTRADAGWAIRGSYTKIGRLESGRSSFKRRDVADLLTLYGVSDETERAGLLALMEEANAPGWRDEYADILLGSAAVRLELEQCASLIRCYETQFVPDLLQTADYARDLIEHEHPGAGSAEIERRTGLLMKRQETLRGPGPCRLWAVVDEAALRRRPGSAASQRGQLEKIIEMAALPRVKIQVMPFATGVTAGGAVTVLRFAEPGVTDVVYLGQFAGAIYVDKPADVQHYGQVMDRLCTRAELPAATRRSCAGSARKYEIYGRAPGAGPHLEDVVSSDQPDYAWDQAEKDLMEGIDTTVPHSARIWNYWLGGKDNYPVDRAAGDAFLKVYPGMAAEARANRQFLARAIRYLVTEAGLRQFLDVGTGLPTADNTHEIAQRLDPACRVVYVDNDPLVLAHARALLTSTPEGVTDYVDADLHDPDAILDAAAEILDFSAPVALILSGIMGHIGDDEGPHEIVRRLMDRLPSGSYLMLQDGTTVSQANADALEDYNSSGAIPYNLRAPEEIVRYFDGLDVVEPGIIPIQQWRPEPDAEVVAEVNTYGGIGRKR